LSNPSDIDTTSQQGHGLLTPCSNDLYA